jgi:hypothetical protein
LTTSSTPAPRRTSNCSRNSIPPTGKELFRERIGAPGQYIASPIIAGYNLIVASTRGVVTVIQVDDRSNVLTGNDFAEGDISRSGDCRKQSISAHNQPPVRLRPVTPTAAEKRLWTPAQDQASDTN